MSVYEYKARDQAGNICSGTYENIKTVSALRDELAKMGYVLTEARRRKKSSIRRKRISQSEVLSFAYKFSEMYSAGLSISKSLETLERQLDNPMFGDVIADVRQDIETGASLEKAFGKYDHIFSDFFIGMLAAGESSGKLAQALDMSAAYLEKHMDLRRKVRSAFAYPVVVCIVCTVVVGGLVGFVVPVFSKLYRQMHVQLPGPTKALVGLSIFLKGYWWTIPFIVAGIVILLAWLLKSPRTKAKWDVLKLNIPVFGKLNRLVVISRFTRTFAMLASVGVSLVRALKMASGVADNHTVSEITKELEVAVEEGHSLGLSMSHYDIFPPVITQLAVSGEEVGELAPMLNKGADFIDRDIERTVNALIVKLEPALTIVMGILVGLILMAVYLPMLDYMQHLE
jgi:type IV pilus assembly protein PilC